MSSATHTLRNTEERDPDVEADSTLFQIAACEFA